jgi:hypothetical protein
VNKRHRAGVWILALAAGATAAAAHTGRILQEDYAEVPTTTTRNPDGTTTLQGNVGGPTFAARDHDPGCTPGVIFGSTCRRICGDLPMGHTLTGVVSQDVNPSGWARFGEIEVYNERTPVRVCFRVKNWAQTANRIFTVKISHAPKPTTSTSSSTISSNIPQVRGDFVYNYLAGQMWMMWRKTDSGWIEDSPAGSSFPPITFRITGRTDVDGIPGTIVRAGDREMDVFIPDIGAKGSRSDWLRQRHGGTDWKWALLGPIVVSR